MKKTGRRLILPLLLMGLMLGGCQQEIASQEQKQTDGGDWIFLDSIYIVNNQGGFYQEDNFLHYMDFQNQKDVLICDRAECNHDKESCAAYFDGMVYPILEEDRIIYISDYEAQQVGQWGGL